MGDQKSARGSFPAKLYELVEGHSTRAASDDDVVVSWCEGGLAFIVKDLTRFCEEVLPQHFCHNKWASFIRQLNLYGFRRITQGQSSGAYWHKYFQRGQPQLLRGITRSRRSASSPFGAGDEEEELPPTGIGAPTPGGFGDKLKKQAAARPAPRGFAATAPWSSSGAVAPMHSGVPLPPMPPLASLAQLPAPPIISDEALLKELDSLVQQQKAQHEKLAAPSPANSSNSLQRVKSDAKISASALRNAPPVTLPSSRLVRHPSQPDEPSSEDYVVGDEADSMPPPAKRLPSTEESPAASGSNPPHPAYLRKRIASHQSVHSVGSLDRGEMTEVGGHPPTQKRFDNQRTMSKSSLASDDWDLNIADVDSLNLDDWRWSEANNSLRGGTHSLNTSLDLSGRGAKTPTAHLHAASSAAAAAAAAGGVGLPRAGAAERGKMNTQVED